MRVVGADSITYEQIGEEGLIQWEDGDHTLILNETANLVWTRLSAGAALHEIVTAVAESYDVDEATARRDIDDLLQVLREEGLVVEDGSCPVE